MLQNDLVQVMNWEIFTTSKIIAEKLEVPHKNFLRTIEKIISRKENLGAPGRTPKFPQKFIKTTFEHWKTKIKYDWYLINEPAFVKIVMQLSQYKKADIVQDEIIQAFFEMKQIILQKQNASWIESRNQWKEIRKQETDKIKEFVDYATKQWSTKAQFYYSNMTKLTYKALELLWNNQPIRDTLNSIWLWMLWVAEIKVLQCLERWMKDWLHYKEIYLLAKQELEEFAKILPKFETKLQLN